MYNDRRDFCDNNVKRMALVDRSNEGSMKVLTINLALRHPNVDIAPMADTQTSFERYDAILVDPTSIEDLFGLGGIGGQPREGQELALIDDISAARVREAVQTRLEQARAFLAGGGLIVCFLRPLAKAACRPSLFNYDWLVKVDDPSSWFPVLPTYSGDLEARRVNNPFLPYLRLKDLKAQAHWIGSTSGVDVLARDRVNRIVALRLRVGQGSVVFLPPSSTRGWDRAIVQSLRDALRGAALGNQVSLPPTWASEYKLQAEMRISREVNEIDEQIEQLRRIKLEKQGELARLGAYSQLLWGTGVKILEPVVAQAFRELGFEAIRRDPIDLVLKCEFGIAYVEIQGSEGTIRIQKVDQLARYIAQSKEPGIKGVIVGNPFRLHAPSNRPPSNISRAKLFSAEVEQFAEVHEYALLTTIELLRAVDLVLNREFTDIASIQKKLFDARGICKLT